MKNGSKCLMRMSKMREIKFRGYDTHDKEWRYGYYLKEKFGNVYICYIVDKYFEYNYGDVYPIYDVDCKSVGQYTELKDKYGMEIYEGDIVKVDGFDELMVVSFRDGYFGWGREHYGAYSFDPFGVENVEVIGNIYKNPELLKGVK